MSFTYRNIVAVFQLLYSAEYCKTSEDRKNIFIHFPFPKDLNARDYFTKKADANDALNELSEDSPNNNRSNPDNAWPQESPEIGTDKIIPQNIKNFVSGVMENTKKIDSEIELNLLKWNINRLGICELIILRMAVYLFIEDLASPEKVIKYIKKLAAQFGLEKAKNLLIQTFMTIVDNKVNNKKSYDKNPALSKKY